MYYIYILRCADQSLYTGITTNLQRRFAQHSGKSRGGAKYTAVHPPLFFEAVWQAQDRSSASRLENRIKKLTRIQKLRLISGQIPASLCLDDYIRLSDEELAQQTTK